MTTSEDQRTPIRAQERPARAHSRHGPVAQLLIAWSPLTLILVAYAAAQWVSAPLAGATDGGTNRWGRPLHVAGPARFDEAVFGVVPSAWLQERLVDGSTHWYDAAAAVVYATHVVAIPLVTAIVWFRVRDRFVGWLAAVLTFVTLGIGGYVAYPAAPPWWASDGSQVPAVQRISGLGWDYLHLDAVARVVASAQGSSNPVAAMPSLHAGSALLVTLFLWPLVGAWRRAALSAYVLAMGLSLVYTGEHYVADVVAGWCVAAVAAAVGVGVGRARRVGAGPGPRAPARPDEVEHPAE